LETVIDTLVVKVDADTSSLRRVLAQAQEDFEAVGAAAESSGEDLEKVREQGRSVGEVLSEVFDNTVARMTGAFEDFLRTGEFSFSTLRNIALAALEDIASAVFENLGAGSDVFTGVIRNIFGGGGGSSFFGSLAGRAVGGQVTNDRPFLVGERGPEVFFPRQAGRVEPIVASPQERPVSITINMNGQSDTAASRESAGQIALQVRRAVVRAQRDM